MRENKMNEVQIDRNVESIVVPENLRVGLMVSEHRKKCQANGCSFDYAGLAFGQSPFPLPLSLQKALCDNSNKGHYSPAEGIAELREAIADFNKRHFNLDVDISRIVIGPGTKDLIFTIFTMVNGDVIIPSPAWIGYHPQLKLLGKQYHGFYTKPEDGYKINPDALSHFLSDLSHEHKQHLIVVNNPNNPTGVVYTKDELTQIADVCRQNNTLVLADEIYALTTYNIDDFTSMGNIYPEGTFVTNGLSKDRSAGGYRLGSCILPKQDSDRLEKEFIKIAATVYTNVSTPTQYAAIEVYKQNEEIEEYLKITRDIHRIIGTFLSREFGKIEGIKTTTPYGGFYFYVDFNDLKDDLKRKGVMSSNDLAESLISHPHHIAVVTGDSVFVQPDNFGARIAFVDHDGKTTFKNYKVNPPQSESEEIEFIKKNAPRMVDSIEKLNNWVKFIRE